MTEYLVPYESAESEFEEKRSRFISHVFLVESEAEARARIDEMKKKYYDARHNCWCFVLHDGTVRYGDDGEPQGTAGQPMLNVFQRENVENVVCIVTRYFGGILLGAHYNNRINTLSIQVNDLRSQLYSVQSNLSSQIDGISNNVSDILTRESSLISQYNYEITNVDLKKQECTIAFSLLPKTISEGTTVIIGVTDHGNSSPLDSYRPGYSADLTQDGFGYLHGSVTVPLSDELGVGVNFKHDGETQSEDLDTIYDLKSRYQPQLKSFLAPISYERQAGSKWQYQFTPGNAGIPLGTISLGALSDVSIRSACLEYTRANQLLRRVPLEASYSDGSAVTYVGDDSAEAVGASVIEGVSYYDLAYASSSESEAFTLPLGATPLVCELVVNLADDTVLRVRLFQMRAIAGGDSYEEINYLDQSLSEPLPFIVEYPDGQN